MIYTYGYLGQSFAALQAWLVANDGVLVDIRMSPNSRQPGWSGGALRAALGAKYWHLHCLGNRNYKGGPIEIVHLEEGVGYLTRWAGPGPLMLLCACRSLLACHRHVVAEELRRRGHAVEELVLGEVVSG